MRRARSALHRLRTVSPVAEQPLHPAAEPCAAARPASGGAALVWCAAAAAATAQPCSLETAQPALHAAENQSDANANASAKWRVYTDVGRDLVQQGKLDDAERYLRRALHEARLGFDAKDAHVAAALNNLAEVYRLRRQFELAEPLYQEALQLLESTLGVSHPSVGATLHNLAGLYLQRRDYGAARDAYAAALAKKEAALGRHHPEYAATLAQLAEVLRLQGRLDDAAALLRESADVLDAVGAGHTHAATARLLRLAFVLSEAGKTADAVAVHRRLLQTAENAADAKPATVAQAKTGLADSLCRISRHDEARALYRQSLATLDAAPGDGSRVSAATVRRRLAEAELAAGGAAALDTAEQLLNVALPVLRCAAGSAAAAAIDAPPPAEETDGKGAGGGKRQSVQAALAAFELAAALAVLALVHQRRGQHDAAEEAIRSAEALLQTAPRGPVRDGLTSKLQQLRRQ